MTSSSLPSVTGRIASLHLHPTQPGAPLDAVEFIDVIADQGIAGEPRYFGRVIEASGRPNRRQITLIEREQVAEHALALGLKSIPAGAVRANIETAGINLVEVIGRQVEIGDAVLFLYQARTPCQKMDAVCNGLRALMENNRQGVVAEIIQSGRIRVDDPIRPRPAGGGYSGGS